MKTITVGADGSDGGLSAVEWAAEAAERRGLPLRIVHASAPWLYTTPVDPRFGAIREWLLTGAQEVVDAAVEAARRRAPDITVEGEAVPGPAARAMLEKAEDAAIVVVGSRGSGQVTGLLFGSTALQVVTHSPVPVVAVRDLEPGVRREIAIGVDGSEAEESAIGFAFEEAGLRKARLRVIHVWSHPSTGNGNMKSLVYDPQLVTEEELRLLAESLAPWREKYPDIEVVPEVVRGRPVRILSGASARADLLVVGTRGRGGFAGLLLGSVSHTLLHHAHCPLAVVPSVPGR